MAMSPSALGSALKSAATSGDPGDPDARWLAIATAIINHIKNNAEVAANIPVATTGSPTAQTGATTAPGTIS